MAPGTRFDRDMSRQVDIAAREVESAFPTPPEQRPARARPTNSDGGFFQMGERADAGPDDEFNEDDITSQAHAELQQHREKRDYARLASYEMPMLSTLDLPAFTPPSTATPLRFRYTSYLGEQHPAARKVVVEFCPADLPGLDAQEQRKLIKLAGSRYEPSTGVVKMAAENFETQAMNKRYLGDLVQGTIKEAKDKEDTFEDVPFDFRHAEKRARRKVRHTFPTEWLLTEERKSAIEEERSRMLEGESTREEQGLLVDGIGAIEEARKIDLARMEAPVMAAAQAKLPAGKMGKRQMGQKGR